jgi:hypothetical protein
MFTIDFVATRDSDTPLESVPCDQASLSGACSFADGLRSQVGALWPHVLGFVIRNAAGDVVHRSYRLFGHAANLSS